MGEGFDGLWVDLSDVVFNLDKVKIRVVFELVNGKFEVKFLRSRAWMAADPNDPPVDFFAFPLIQPEQNIMDLQGIRTPEKHGLLVKIVQEGNTPPLWGVGVEGMKVETLYYLKKYFQDPNVKVRYARSLK